MFNYVKISARNRPTCRAGPKVTVQTGKQSLKEPHREHAMTWQQREGRQVLIYTEAGVTVRHRWCHVMAERASAEVGHVTGHREQRQNQNKTGNTDWKVSAMKQEMFYESLSAGASQTRRYSTTQQLHYPTSYLAYSLYTWFHPNLLNLSALLAVHKTNNQTWQRALGETHTILCICLGMM